MNAAKDFLKILWFIFKILWIWLEVCKRQIITKENKLSTGPFHIRAVQYNIYSLNVMARDENVWPTSTLPRLGRMLWCDIINLTLHRHAIFYKLTLLTKAWYRFKFIDTIMIDNILSHEWKRFIYLQIKMQSI